MVKSVFICHASSNAGLASRMAEGLEARGISCWIAPRDVPAGSGWGGAIIDAISQCRVMVLLFSRAANRSPQVLREVERAVHHGRGVLMFRLEPVKLSRDLEFFTSAHHWLDAFPGEPEEHFDELFAAVQRLLEEQTAGPAAEGDDGIDLSERTKEEAEKIVPRRRKKPRMERWLMATAVVACTAVAAWFGVRHWTHPTAALTLTAPADGAILVRPSLILEWEPKPTLDREGLSFETETWLDGATPQIKRLTRESCSVDDLEGHIHWQVRPVWRGADGQDKIGEWTAPRTFTYYHNALSRLRHTHTLHVGIAEADGIFVVDEAGRIGGAEIELLQAIANRLGGGEVRLIFHTAVWGPVFFGLLADEDVDLLASGISISAEREQKYGMAFTQRTFEYPQAVIIHEGTATVDASGKLALHALGVVQNTTNETLANALDQAAGGGHLKPPYHGSGPYIKMIADLVDGRLDGVLMDEPYALQQVADNKRRQPGSDLTVEDVRVHLAPNQKAEQIGFALRRNENALRNAMDEQITALDALKRTLIERYLAKPLPTPAGTPAP